LAFERKQPAWYGMAIWVKQGHLLTTKQMHASGNLEDMTPCQQCHVISGSTYILA